MQTDYWTKFIKAREEMEVRWVHSEEYKHIKSCVDDLLEELKYPKTKYAKTNGKGYRQVHTFYPPPLQVVSEDKELISYQLELIKTKSEFLTFNFGIEYIPDRTIEGFQEWMLSRKDQ